MTCPTCHKEVLFDHVLDAHSRKRECDICGAPAVGKRHGLQVCADCKNL